MKIQNKTEISAVVQCAEVVMLDLLWLAAELFRRPEVFTLLDLRRLRDTKHAEPIYEFQSGAGLYLHQDTGSPSQRVSKSTWQILSARATSANCDAVESAAEELRMLYALRQAHLSWGCVTEALGQRSIQTLRHALVAER